MNHTIPEQRKKWGVVRGAAIVLNALPAVIALFAGSHLGSVGLTASGILYIAFLSAIARWKKWGVYGLAALFVIAPIAMLINGLPFSNLLLWAVFPMLIFASVYSKWHQME